MRFLATGDIHLTDLPRDEYRWSIFKFLRQHAAEKQVDRIFILGDLTDRKDEHSGRLVNRIVDELNETNAVAKTVVIKGNHDYDQDPDVPFFRFWPNFISQVDVRNIKGKTFLIVPHTRRFIASDLPLRDGWDFIFVHHTFTGAVASNGFALEGGTSPKTLGKDVVGEKCVVLSGDIHVPQKIGNITYCGAPHPVAFGDSFEPRIIYYDGEKINSIPHTTIKKAMLKIKDVAEIAGSGLTSGDQVRIEYRMNRRDFSQWSEIREQIMKTCESMGLLLSGCEMTEIVSTRKRLADSDAPVAQTKSVEMTRQEVLAAFCAERGIDETYSKVGMGLL